MKLSWEIINVILPIFFKTIQFPKKLAKYLKFIKIRKILICHEWKTMKWNDFNVNIILACNITLYVINDNITIYVNVDNILAMNHEILFSLLKVLLYVLEQCSNEVLWKYEWELNKKFGRKVLSIECRKWFTI